MITINLLYVILLYLLYALMYLAIPAVVLYPAVKERRLGFRVLFYQISGLTYVTLASFLLCFAKLYITPVNWLVFLIFPVALRIFLSRKTVAGWIRDELDAIKERKLIGESINSRHRRFQTMMKKLFSLIYTRYIRGHVFQLLSILLIAVLVAWNLGFFHLHYYTYACSDEPTHIYWTSCLVNGNPFPAGLYPHGMHFIVGGFCSLFGLDPARAWLSFGIVSVTIILGSVYLLIRRLFSSRVAAVLSIAVFLMSGLYGSDTWFTRLLMVMPMELAMYACMTMVYGLISWVKDRKLTSLLMVGMGILGTTFLHVFVTIFAFFVVVAFVIVYHNKMARQKIIYQLVACGMVSIMIAVLPYVVGIAAGYKLEQSFSWGMSVVSTSASSSSSDDEDSSDDAADDDAEAAAATTSSSSVPAIDAFLDAETPQDMVDAVANLFSSSLTQYDWGAYVLIAAFLLTFLFGIAGVIKNFRDEERKDYFLGFVFVSIGWVLTFTALYIFYTFDIFSLMVPSRSSEFIAIFSITLLAAPVEIVYWLLDRLPCRAGKIDAALGYVSCLAAACACFLGIGMTYRDLEYGFSMENLDIKTEEDLIANNEPETWTVISTTNARMAVLYHGYHYEITDLLMNILGGRDVYIPTKDIYIMVEKNVPLMGSKNVDGSDFMEETVPVSLELASVLLTDVLHVQDGAINSEVYLTDYSRQVIMSHFYWWMEALKDAYPSEITVYDEDDYCTIYHVRQDEYFLLNLSVDYRSLVKSEVDKARARGEIVVTPDDPTGTGRGVQTEEENLTAESAVDSMAEEMVSDNAAESGISSAVTAEEMAVVPDSTASAAESVSMTTVEEAVSVPESAASAAESVSVTTVEEMVSAPESGGSAAESMTESLLESAEVRSVQKVSEPEEAESVSEPVVSDAVGVAEVLQSGQENAVSPAESMADSVAEEPACDTKSAVSGNLNWTLPVTRISSDTVSERKKVKDSLKPLY